MKTLRFAAVSLCLANALGWGLYSGRPLIAVAWLLLAAACPRLIRGN